MRSYLSLAVVVLFGCGQSQELKYLQASEEVKVEESRLGEMTAIQARLFLTKRQLADLAEEKARLDLVGLDDGATETKVAVLKNVIVMREQAEDDFQKEFGSQLKQISELIAKQNEIISAAIQRRDSLRRNN